MGIGSKIKVFTCGLLAAGFPLVALAGAPLNDQDGDNVPDVSDNCSGTANAFPLNCDTDMDGYGNACDCDFNNNFTCTDDFAAFRAQFAGSGVGTADANCNGTATDDFAVFRAGFAGGAGTLESGLGCAGSAPCP